MKNKNLNLYPHNELAKDSKMTMNELLVKLSDIQDELHLRGFEDAAQLVHRTLGQLQVTLMNHEMANKFINKKNIAA